MIMIGVIFMVANLLSGGKTSELVGVNFDMAKKQTVSTTSSAPTTPPYNPPKEVKYDANTDLNQALQSVDPKVDETDFSSLNNLIKSL